MVNLLTKRYSGLIDIYTQSVTINPETNETVRNWNYAMPKTIRCNATSIKAEDSLEQFAQEYRKKLYVLIESPTPIRLRNQAGNIRNRFGEPYYPGDGVTVFNVSSINTQIDALGNTVCFEAYLEYYDEFSDGIAKPV